MIEIKEVTKFYDRYPALSKISLTIPEGTVFGLLGTNGAGKSTLLRLMAGVLKADTGTITIDEEAIWDNPKAKEKFFYISDDQYFYPNSTPKDLAGLYGAYYKDFDKKRFFDLVEKFQLGVKRKVSTYSKGMKKQLSILLGICAGTPYLFCDETFDGLDPVMRQAIKSLFSKEMEERPFTPVIASHNLRELEDICDYIGLIHMGGVLLSRDLSDLKCTLQKVQCVLPEEDDEALKEALDILQFNRRGKLITMTVRGEAEMILDIVESFQPVYHEILPLSLEEIFISETEVVGYDIKKLIL